MWWVWVVVGVGVVGVGVVGVGVVGVSGGVGGG